MRATMVILVSLIAVSLAMPPLAAEAESEKEGHAHTSRHHVGLFLGNTHTDHDDGFTFGLDYEYRLTEQFGLAGVLDYATDVESTVVGAGVFIHRFENHDGHNEYLFRTGLYYDISLDESNVFRGAELTISPTFIVDFVDGDEDLVFGLTIGYKF